MATGSPEKLKKTFDTSRYVEVSFDQPVGPELFAAPGITRAESWGDKWRVYTDDPDRAVKVPRHRRGAGPPDDRVHRDLEPDARRGVCPAHTAGANDGPGRSLPGASLVITEKNMRIYYFKGPVVVFGLLFPLIMFLTFFIGRNLDLVLFFPGFLGMMLFFTASSVGPLITPWEKREKTYERLVSLPVILESIIIGDLLAGAIFGIAITTIVFVVCAVLLHLPLMNAGLLALSFVLGSITFAALGTLLASPTTDNPSNIMMLSSLIRLPLIFVSGHLHPAQPAERLGMDPHLALPAHVPCRPVPRSAERRRGLPAVD